MEYAQITLDQWVSMKDQLKQDILDAQSKIIGLKKDFVKIGYKLRKIDEMKLYENDGYKSVAEFAKTECNLTGSDVTRFMKINERYSIDGYSEELRPEFLEYGSSKLAEMLSLPDKDMEMIRPEAARESIRELKSFNKTEPAAGVADDIVELIERFYEKNPEILNELYTSGTIFSEDISLMTEIVNPAGNKSFKKGMFFLMMYEDTIKIKKFGGAPQNMSWQEFFEITRSIFEEDSTSTNIWEKHFGKTDETQVDVIPNEETVIKTEENVPKTEKSVPKPEKSALKPEEKPQSSEKEISKKEKLSTPEPVQTDEKTSKSEPVPKPEETVTEEIAPAQKFLENQEKIPHLIQEEPAQEVIEKPFGNRKDYLDTLTAYGAAEYLYKDREELIEALKYDSCEVLEMYLTRKVDEHGQTD